MSAAVICASALSTPRLMLTLLAAVLCCSVAGKKEVRVLILGLDNAGECIAMHTEVAVRALPAPLD